MGWILLGIQVNLENVKWYGDWDLLSRIQLLAYKKLFSSRKPTSIGSHIKSGFVLKVLRYCYQIWHTNINFSLNHNFLLLRKTRAWESPLDYSNHFSMSTIKISGMLDHMRVHIAPDIYLSTHKRNYPVDCSHKHSDFL